MYESSETPPAWQRAAKAEEVTGGKPLKVRIGDRQISLFRIDNEIHASDNRCPHEGYPLVEGSVDEYCILTCNWHNWKFDLRNGDNLFGGDRLRIYPVEIRDEEIWVDVSDPPFGQQYEQTTTNLKDAFDDHEYDRIAREIARLEKIGADPLDSLRLAVQWSHDRMEFGMTHAYAGMADWLALYDEYEGDRETRLVCLVESVAHCAFDVLREPQYPYDSSAVAYTAEKLVKAIEAEDDAQVSKLIRGGIESGLGFGDFEPVLAQAALAHYNDFGHSAIYITKARILVERLGNDVLAPLLLALGRALVYATREERIPEFRQYDQQLANWGKQGACEPQANDWHKQGINSALATTVACSESKPESIYRELLQANAVSLLSFDIEQQWKTHVTVSGNVNWLDFSHGITFANAVRDLCSRYPELWPRGLLQMACFSGRNAAFTKPEYDMESWGSENPSVDIGKLVEQAIDHGQDEHIVSVHWIKTVLAAREEIRHLETGSEAESTRDYQNTLYAGVNRYINSPLKRKQTRRTAWQSLKFVEKE